MNYNEFEKPEFIMYFYLSGRRESRWIQTALPSAWVFHRWDYLGLE